MGISLDNRGKKVNDLIDRYGDCCFFCELRLDTRKFINCRLPALALTIEHIIPRGQGGSNAVTNLVLSCNRCNNRRGAEDFLAFADTYRSLTDRDRFVYQQALDYAHLNLLGYYQTTIDDYIGGRSGNRPGV